MVIIMEQARTSLTALCADICDCMGIKPPESAEKSAGHLKKLCGEETAEHLCRLQNGVAVCLDCAVGYDRFRV